MLRRREDRIAPFRPFRRCERQCLVEHGVEYVDKRNFGDQTGVEVRPHVGDRADQRSAGRPAVCDDLSPALNHAR